MRVLYLSYDGLTDPLGQSQILPYLIGLSRQGYLISIVSFEKIERSQGLDEIQKICSESNIDWNPLRYHRRPAVFSTLYDVWSLLRMVKKLNRQKEFSIIHCRSYITPLVGHYMKKKFGHKFIFDMRGFWADERVEGGLWNLDSRIYRIIFRFFKKKERDFIEGADAVVVLTHAAKEIVHSWSSKSNVVVIPCAADLEIFNPSAVSDDEKKMLRSQLGISPNDFVLLYLGSLGTWYLWNEMTVFFNTIKQQHPSARFLIITPDTNVVKGNQEFIVRTAKRNDVPKYISICNAAVCFIKPMFSKSGSSATKVGEILAMGIPVYLNAGWGDVSLYYKNQPNLIVDFDHLNDFRTEGRNDGATYRKLASEYFNLENGISSYRQIYNSLTQERA